MSFKGFSKSLARAPQQFKVKFNIGEHTKDAVYTDSERRFQELEKETKKLHDESKKYFDAINGKRLYFRRNPVSGGRLLLLRQSDEKEEKNMIANTRLGTQAC